MFSVLHLFQSHFPKETLINIKTDLLKGVTEKHLVIKKIYSKKWPSKRHSELGKVRSARIISLANLHDCAIVS